jgi:hypothetical protein
MDGCDQLSSVGLGVRSPRRVDVIDADAFPATVLAMVGDIGWEQRFRLGLAVGTHDLDRRQRFWRRILGIKQKGR